MRYLDAQGCLPAPRAPQGSRMYGPTDVMLARLYVRLVAVHAVPVSVAMTPLANFRDAVRDALESPVARVALALLCSSAPAEAVLAHVQDASGSVSATTYTNCRSSLATFAALVQPLPNAPVIPITTDMGAKCSGRLLSVATIR